LSDVFEETETEYRFNTYPLEMNIPSLSFISLLLSSSLLFLTFFQFPRHSPLRLYITSARISLMKLSGNKKKWKLPALPLSLEEGGVVKERGSNPNWHGGLRSAFLTE
jgi:hypothetical protein